MEAALRPRWRRVGRRCELRRDVLQRNRYGLWQREDLHHRDGANDGRRFACKRHHRCVGAALLDRCGGIVTARLRLVIGCMLFANRAIGTTARGIARVFAATAH